MSAFFFDVPEKGTRTLSEKNHKLNKSWVEEMIEVRKSSAPPKIVLTDDQHLTSCTTPKITAMKWILFRPYGWDILQVNGKITDEETLGMRRRATSYVTNQTRKGRGWHVGA